MKRLKYEAFFLTPDDEIIPVPLCLNHIDVICDHPEWFGFEREQVKSVFKKHNEPLRSEKRARNELMLETYKKGFIRLRYRDNHYWIAESENIFGNKKMGMQIAGWIKFMLDHEDMNADIYMEVEELDTDQNETLSEEQIEGKRYLFVNVDEYPKTIMKFKG